jgi:threonylcarbamoyladenosine tRNA methylthiotransferase MtaB
MARSAVFFTLGCKLNQAESEAWGAAFRAAGYAVFDGDAPMSGVGSAGGADVALVNTCTVTSKADQKARRLIRALLRAAPAAPPRVIVTGCLARLNRAELEALDKSPPSARRLFIASDAESALRLLQDLLPAPPVPAPPDSAPGLFHSRAFLKIQDGCDKRCTYCRVRLARGPSRSLARKSVLARLRALEECGVAEAVLTGVNIAQYRDEGCGLGALIGDLLRGTERIALRLSSLEPAAFCAELYGALAEDRVRPHFHLSVQSGDAEVLRAMGREYTAEDVRAVTARLRALRGDPFIACDMIAGFPGESAAAFERSYALCREADFAWIHAFPFSPRPGTAARTLGGRPPEREAAMRVSRLFELARRGKKEYIGRWMGREVDAVFEDGGVEHDGAGHGGAGLGGGTRILTATTENYLKLAVVATAGAPHSGEGARCVIGGPFDPADADNAGAGKKVKADAWGKISR